MEAFKKLGHWWLPSAPDTVLSGILSFDAENGAELSLVGTFRPDDNLVDPFFASIILGGTDDGQLVTLYRAHEMGGTLNIGGSGVETTKFHPTYVFLGHHFESPENVRSAELSVCFEHLTHWAQHSGIQVTYEQIEGHPLKQTATYVRPSDIQISLDFGALAIGVEIESRFDGASLRWAEDVYVEFSYDHPRNVVDCLNGDVVKFRNFISVAVGEATQVTKVFIPIPHNGHQKRVHVYYKLGRSVRHNAPVDVFKALYRLPKLKDDLAEVVRAWFRNYDELEPVFNLYFAVVYAEGMYLESQLQNLTQAIESFHRIRGGGLYLDRSSFKHILSSVRACIGALPGIPDRVREIFNQKVAHLNEYTLRTRLLEILGELSPVLEGIIPDAESFARDAISTRNQLTHVEARTDEGQHRVVAMYEIVLRLRFLVEMVLLRETGMSLKRLRELATTSQRYRRVEASLTRLNEGLESER